MNPRLLLVVPFALLASPALAHVGLHAAGDFSAGALHPLTGIDHLAAMIAVGLLAASKGGRALWLWPLAFVGVMIGGGLLGMSHVALPLVEPAILASVLTLGLIVALAIDLPIRLGAIIIAAFALFHGYAHGAEMPDTLATAAYLGGLAVATAALHLVGIGVAVTLTSARWQPALRLAGVACVAVGVGIALNAI